MSLIELIHNTDDLSILLEANQVLNKQIEKVRKQKLIEAKKQAKKLAEDLGISISELLDSEEKKPKFVNPNNPKQTWGGRGKKPNWVVELLNNGQSLDDLKEKHI